MPGDNTERVGVNAVEGADHQRLNGSPSAHSEREPSESGRHGGKVGFQLRESPFRSSSRISSDIPQMTTVDGQA